MEKLDDLIFFERNTWASTDGVSPLSTAMAGIGKNLASLPRKVQTRHTLSLHTATHAPAISATIGRIVGSLCPSSILASIRFTPRQ